MGTQVHQTDTMGFADFLSDAGLSVLNSWLTTRSYIVGYAPSQADVASFKALTTAPDSAKYPHAARWYKHIASYTEEFATLPGDASKPYTTYGPDVAEVTLNPAKAPAAAEEEDDDVDLFGSDDEEEDAEAERIRNERLAEYKKKKEGKTKPAAKSVVTMDVKPWDDETDMKELVASRRRVSSGVLPSLSLLVSVSRNCRLTWLSRMTRLVSPSCKRRLRSSRITSNRPISLLCKSCRRFSAF